MLWWWVKVMKGADSGKSDSSPKDVVTKLYVPLYTYISFYCQLQCCCWIIEYISHKVYKVAWPELYGSPHWQQSLVLHSRFCYHKLISLSWELGNIWCTQQCKFTTRAGSSVCLGRQDARVLWRPGNLHLLWSRGTGRAYPSARTENHIEIHYMLGETDTWWKQWFHKLGDQKRQGRWQH